MQTLKAQFCSGGFQYFSISALKWVNCICCLIKGKCTWFFFLLKKVKWHLAAYELSYLLSSYRWLWCDFNRYFVLFYSHGQCSKLGVCKHSPYRPYHKGDLLAIQSLLQFLVLLLLYKHRHTIIEYNIDSDWSKSSFSKSSGLVLALGHLSLHN